jgi:hypothetical protein
VQQQVKGITSAEFNVEAKADFITAVVSSLETEMPHLRTSHFTITGVTTTVARRQLGGGGGLNLNPNLNPNPNPPEGMLLRGSSSSSSSSSRGGGRSLGANSVIEVEYEVEYVAEELGCGTHCLYGEDADTYFRAQLNDATKQATIATFLSSYSSNSAFQAGVVLQSTVFPNAYTQTSYQTRPPTSMPTGTPSSWPTAEPNMGPDKYSSLWAVYGTALLLVVALCCGTSMLAVFSYMYPSICTPWFLPCCLSPTDREYLRYFMARKQLQFENLMRKKDSKSARRLGRTALLASSNRYKVAPLGGGDVDMEGGARVRILFYYFSSFCFLFVTYLSVCLSLIHLLLPACIL